MGPLLTALRRGATGLLLTLSLTGLRCAPGCREEAIPLELSAPYSGYFSALTPLASAPDGRVAAARSSTGLSDSYPHLFVTTTPDFPMPEPRSCTYYLSAGRTVHYTPTLYRRTFTLSVAQYPDGPVLILREYPRSSPTDYANSELYYLLAERRPGRVRYFDAAQTSYQYFDAPADAQTLPTLTVAGRSYQGVLRLTNPYAARHGAANSATVYYVAPDYGLVRFEQRDGTVWDLTP